MKALILVAGFGTRLYPLTKDIPKPLITVKEKPIMEYIIENLQEIEELNEIYILSNNKFYMKFLEWLNDYKEKCPKKLTLLNNGVSIDTEMKGAVRDFKETLEIIGIEDLMLIAGDNLFKFDLKPIINLGKEKNSSMVILKTSDDEEFLKKMNSILLDENNKLTYYEEKPQIIKSNIFSIACYYLKKEDVIKIKEHKFERTDNFGDLIHFLHKNSVVHGKISDEFWVDIGSLEELEKARKEFN